MDKVAVLTAILGNFDTPVDPVVQDGISDVETTFHRFTDEDFPPITGLTPRFQYRIPKYFGWQMFPGHDTYIWLDGSVSLVRHDSLKWLLDQLGDADMAVFKHPYRQTIQEETDHLETYLNRSQGTSRGQDYLTARYKNGLHKEQLEDIKLDTGYTDDHLYASTSFIYRDSEAVRDALRLCFLHQARYYTCDQLAFTYALKGLQINIIDANPFKGEYVREVSKHK